jgi:hypothetical protein
MANKPASVSISTLARYASNPSSVFDKVNAKATRYGNRAHNAIGRGPSLIGYVVIAIIILVAAKMSGLFG